MAESHLDKVLRLAGGITRAYVHQVAGRPVQVRAYQTPHPAMGKPTGPGGAGQVLFSQLKKGMVVDIKNQDYIVTAVNVPASGPNSGFTTGSGVKTTSGKNTSSQGKGLNTASNNPTKAAAQAAAAGSGATLGSSRQNPAQAVLGGKAIPKGIKTVTHMLKSKTDGSDWYVTLPADMSVTIERG